jgi:hypothetical protein
MTMCCFFRCTIFCVVKLVWFLCNNGLILLCKYDISVEQRASGSRSPSSLQILKRGKTQNIVFEGVVQMLLFSQTYRLDTCIWRHTQWRHLAHPKSQQPGGSASSSISPTKIHCRIRCNRPICGDNRPRNGQKLIKTRRPIAWVHGPRQ